MWSLGVVFNRPTIEIGMQLSTVALNLEPILNPLRFEQMAYMLENGYAKAPNSNRDAPCRPILARKKELSTISRCQMLYGTLFVGCGQNHCKVEKQVGRKPAIVLL